VTQVAKKTAPLKKAAAPARTFTEPKPITSAFHRSSLLTHPAQLTAVELKVVKAVIASREATMLASVPQRYK